MNFGRIIDGRSAADTLLVNLFGEVKRLQAEYAVTPKLVVVIVGEDPASQIYVRNKARVAKKIGVLPEVIELPSSISEDELSRVIKNANEDNSVHGIIVQLPLPMHINPLSILYKIDPIKDVDGFHPYNVGKLHIGDESGMVPCTALGVIHLLKMVTNLEGKNAVVLGRSQIVGKPTAALLLRNNCTVTIAHSHSQGLQEITNSADIIVSAVGSPRFLTKDYFKDGAIVIDVGITRVGGADDSALFGDVDFENVLPKVSHITPVPGGVGPMTITFLLSNTIRAARALL